MGCILGLSAFYHDSAAALIRDGDIIAAAQEERFTRKKHDAGFPANAIQSILEQAQVKLSDVDQVVFYDKPFLKFERLLETYLATAPKGLRSFSRAMPIWLREKLFLKSQLLQQLRQFEKNFGSDRLMFSEHHLSHAASAFYPSPFEHAVVLTLDGVGEWATTTVAIGHKAQLKIVKELHFPHSLGLLYSAFTHYIGFKVNSGEYKLMGLAPYGEPRYKQRILERLVDVKADGSFRLQQSYFNYMSGLTMTGKKFAALFGQPARQPDSSELSQFHMDIAASIQAVTEEVVLRMTRALAAEYRLDNLCLAGGVALNCVANSRLLNDGCFNHLWVQPAAGDAGGALGAALAFWHHELGHPRRIDSPDSMQGGYLGPQFSNRQIETELTAAGAVFARHSEAEIIDRSAHAIAAQKVVGWFQGRMEFGPRALGGRSIIADPRAEGMQKTLNLKVKFRESFRPFAPSVLCEDADHWFELQHDSPYMLLVANIKPHLRTASCDAEKSLTGIDRLHVKRSALPAITHVDYSARVQTVHRQTNPGYYALIERFKQLTGCPVIINTSFNVRGEPLVCSPTDAFNCFMGTDIDVLAVGNCILYKEEQPTGLLHDGARGFDPD